MRLIVETATAAMATRIIGPSVILAIASFTGFAFQIFITISGVCSIFAADTSKDLFKCLRILLMYLFIVNFVFLGMLLVPFFVMIGVAVSFVRPKQALVRWTPTTAAILAVTILSYAISVFINFAVTLP